MKNCCSMTRWRSSLIYGTHRSFFSMVCQLMYARNAVVLGILYLTFQAFPFIFGTIHGFNTQSSGMSFLGIGVGMIMAISTQPFWNRYIAFDAHLNIISYFFLPRFTRQLSEKNNGVLPPEARLVMGEFGGVLIPFGE